MKWIDVKKELPKRDLGNESKIVLGHWNGYIALYRYDYSDNSWYLANRFLNPNAIKITHWMPLPELPNSELTEPQPENGKLPIQHISERVVIMLYDCSREGIKNRIDKYDVVDCNTGIILFTGTSEECKSKYTNYIKPHFR